MKTVPYPEGKELYYTTASVDWKADAEQTIEAIDDLLTEHGLQVMVYDTGADSILFSVVPLDE